MRALALLTGAAVLALAGCGPERDAELQRAVAQLGAGENANVWCEWGDWSDDSYHESCLYFVPATPQQVARKVLAKLGAHGYRPACRRVGPDLTVIAAGSDRSINATVIDDDFPYASVVPPEEIEVPDGHTALLLRVNLPPSENIDGKPIACP